MKKTLFFIGILLIVTAQLFSQVEFIDEMNLGYAYGFVENKDRAGSYFIWDYSFGVHIHQWNTSVLVTTNFLTVLFGNDLDLGLQIDHYFGYDGIRLTGFGLSLGSGFQYFENTGILFIRIGGFWHFAKIIKFGVDLDYRFNEQLLAGIKLTIPVGTVYSRFNTFDRVYGGGPVITIVNNTGYQINQVYVKQNSSSWGQNRMENNQILSNEKSFQTRLEYPVRIASRCDIRIIDSDGNIYIKQGVTITGENIIFTSEDIVR